jgi:glutamate-5-semialdehyde dehydrogenase
MRTIEAICMDAKMASRPLASAGAEQKNRFLDTLANWLALHQDRIIAENALDIQDAKKDGLSEALIDRLTLTAERIFGMADDLRHLIALPDPVGEVFERSITEQGLKVRKQRVPLGLLAVIYESRPNVTVDVAALAIKSGNAIILRGGKETIRTNQVLVNGIHSALAESALPTAAVQFISEPDRSHVEELLKMYDHIDMLIPRGGAALHRYCRENSSIPVITGGIGICHLFVDQSADLAPSLQVIRNAKVQRPTVCNALDTVLVHRAIAADLIPRLIAALAEEGVAFRLDERAMVFADGMDTRAVSPAGPDDFDTEWLSLVLGIKVVDGLDEAIEHIGLHSTHHSDGILTQDKDNAERFTALVDSAAVYVNASTRFTDGSQLGLGAEVAISTQRLHARGPMALRELTTYKWVIEGDYTTRA